jgi:gluconate kinase
MHSTMQQTPFFANHDLHPKFELQGVNNVMNLAIKDRVVWLANIRT